MCGIAGIRGKLANQILLNKMLQRISHRGEELYQHESLLRDNLTIV